MYKLTKNEIGLFKFLDTIHIPEEILHGGIGIDLDLMVLYEALIEHIEAIKKGFIIKDKDFIFNGKYMDALNHIGKINNGPDLYVFAEICKMSIEILKKHKKD